MIANGATALAREREPSRACREPETAGEQMGRARQRNAVGLVRAITAP